MADIADDILMVKETGEVEGDESNETVIQVMLPGHKVDMEMAQSKAYSQKYRSQWESEPMFKDWLMPVPGDPHSAACRSCETTLRAHRKLLVVHCTSQKHLQHKGNFNPTFTPGRRTARGRGRPRVLRVPSAGRAVPQREPSPPTLSDVSYTDASRVTYAIGLGTQRVGFIGAGSMAQVLVRGMLDKGLVVPAKVLVSAATDRNYELWRRWGCRVAGSNDEVLQECDIVFLAVKPEVLEPLVADLQPVEESRSQCVLSLVAGVPRARVAALLATRRSSEQLHVVRCLPNTPLMIGEGCCLYTVGAELPHSWLLAVETVFSALGMCQRVDESLLDGGAGAFSSGPAFAYSFIEALAAGAVHAGVPWHLARSMAAQTTLGAARMLLETGRTPAELRDEASAPGGTTIAGLMALEKNGMKYAVMSAVEAAAQRSKNLGDVVPMFVQCEDE